MCLRRSRWGVRFAAALGLIGLSNTCARAQEIYFNDFSVSAGPEWSDTSISTTPIGARRFLGEFEIGSGAGKTVSLNLAGIPSHSSIDLSFDLFALKSWDGNGNSCCGPDVFTLGATGPGTLLLTTFSNTGSDTVGGGFDNRQAYPGPYPGGDFHERTGAAENNTLGYGFFAGGGVFDLADSVYHLNFVFPHVTSTLTVNFNGTALGGSQGIGDESWGLDNVRVTATPEPGSLAFAVTISSAALLTMWNRRRPQSNDRS